MKKTFRQQKKMKGRIRDRSAAMLLPAIRAKLQMIAEHEGVTESYVEATILADALGIDEQERYYDESTTTRKVNARVSRKSPFHQSRIRLASTR